MNWNVCGLPAGDDESATLLAIADTYFAKLAVTDHFWSPAGSHTMPTRGLQALSCATRRPALSAPRLRSKRTPRFAVSRLPTRQLSLKNSECVRKFVPWLPTGIGFHWMIVVPSPR